jgi:hypothetical protein
MVAETPTRVFESTYPLYVDADSSVPVGLHRRPGRGSGGGRPAVEEVLAVDELPQRHARVLLVGEAGTGKTVALRRMAAQQQLHGEASVQPRFLRLDGSRSLTSLVEMLSERERSLLLVDGLERLDHRERREAAGTGLRPAPAHDR